MEKQAEQVEAWDVWEREEMDGDVGSIAEERSMPPTVKMVFCVFVGEYKGHF